METIQTNRYSSPFGELIIGSYKEKICLCDWKYRKMRKAIDQRISKGLDANFKEGNSEVIEDCIVQLEEYFKGDRQQFDVPLLMVGSDFQKQVWDALLNISYGQTKSYSGLAGKLGDEMSVRAVASANGANALAIIVPCHRVIGRNGEMTGYAGGIGIKRKLLELEKEETGFQLELFG